MLEVSCDLPGDETTPEPPAERFLPVDRDGDARYSVHERRACPVSRVEPWNTMPYLTPEPSGVGFFLPLISHKEELHHV